MAPSSAPHKFPSISHPLSRLGSRETLSIFGKSRDGAVSADWSLRSLSPQHLIRSHSVAGTNLAVSREDRDSARSSTSHDSRKITTEEVLTVLEEKLRSGNFHATKKLFRSNDPSGEGNVTKEAFSRIIWNLCGYLSPRKISHVLRRMGLDKSSSITLEDLVAYFRRPYTHGGLPESIVKSSHLQKAPHSAPERYTQALTPQLETIKQYLPPEAAAEQSWKAFKAMASTGQLVFEDLFPPMCFGEGAYIIPGQLRECLQKLAIPSSDVIVARILRKLEGASPYAIRTSKLFQHLGLNSDGKVIAKHGSEPAKSPTFHNSSSESPDNRATSQSRSKTSLGGVQSTRPQTSLASPTPIPMRPKTSLDHVAIKMFDGDLIDLVAKKLDEGQVQFVRALESKCVNSSGMISKVELRGIFKNFGFPVNATTLEHFLAKNGLRRSDGMVNFRLLIRRMQTRSGRGTLSKVMKNQEHVFHNPPSAAPPVEEISASILESKLLDIFHKEFLSLLNGFRESDPSGTGLLTVDEFKCALEDRFAISITPNSWEQFLVSSQVRFVQPPNTATQGQKGYIPYNEFLAKFDVTLRPSTVDAEDPWIQEEVDADRLKEHKERYIRSMGADPADHTHRHEPRTLDQLEATLVDVFLYKFHNFKKEFDLIVREDFCRVDKEKFDYILFRCGFVLTPSELSQLWSSMPITRPMESLSMPTILQQVMRLYYGSTMPGKFSKTSRDSAIVSHVLEKIRVPIISHWNLLKKKLRYLDPMGTSRVEKAEMLQILRGLQINITDLELHYLIEMLESRIAGKTNYFRLMEYFVKRGRKSQSQGGSRAPLLSTDSERVYPKTYRGRDLPKQHDYRHPTPQKPELITLRNAPSTPPFKRVNVDPGVAKPFQRSYDSMSLQDNHRQVKRNEHFGKYRGSFELLNRHPLSSQGSYATQESLVQKKVKPQVGAGDISFMGRAMRKADQADSGRISVEAFLKILSNYGVTFQDPNEIYKLLSRYDRKLRDEISYEKFLKALV